jgi:hypothetical protein
MFRRTPLTACVLLLACAGAAPAQTGMLDLIPDEALAGFAIRDLNDLKKKGDKFLADAELKLPLRPSQLFAMACDFLGVRGGIDHDGTAALVLVRPEKADQRGRPDSFVAVLPFTDRDQIAANFGFAKGELQPGRMMAVKDRNFGHFVYVHGKHLFLGDTEKAIERVARGKPAGRGLSADRRRALNGADMLLHLGAREWGPDWKGFLKSVEEGLGKSDDPAEQQVVRQLLDSLGSTRYVLGAFHVGDGFGVSFLAALDPPPDEAAKAFLAGLAGGPGGSDLRGLPEGHAVVAQAVRGDGGRNALVAKLFLDFILRDLVETKKVIAAADRPVFTGVFTEVWRRLQGSRTALYLNRDEPKHGLFSAVAILDTDDAAKFLADMRVLAKIADGSGLKLGGKSDGDDAVEVAQLVRDLGDAQYRVRAAATTKLRLAGEPALPYLAKAAEAKDLEVSRRAQKLQREIETAAAQRRKELLEGGLPWRLRPELAFVPRAEQRSGRPIDIVSIKLVGKDEGMARQLRQLFGPDWDKLRLAVHGKQVVALLGSDVALLDEALKNLADGRPGLAAAPDLAAFGRQADPGRKVEFHVSVAGLLALVTPPGANARVPAKPGRALSSFSLSLGPQQLQLDVWVPSAEFRTVANEWLRLGL